MAEDPGSFPRVLVLCDEPINTISGGGVTMGNLFRGWPPDKLGQVWAHHRFTIDDTICPNYLRLGEHKMPGESWVPESLRRQRELVRKLRPLLRPGIRLDYARVLQWVRDFAPDVIYSQATPYPMYTWWLPRWLARDLQIPLVNHIMDDWPAAIRHEWPLFYRQIMLPFLRQQLRQLFNVGVCNLVICEQMAEAFSVRYDKAFLPFHNMIDLEHWTMPKEDFGQAGDVFQVVYLGALSEDNQVHSLRDIALAIGALVQRGVRVCLTVHTGDNYLGHYRQFLEGIPGVTHGGSVSRERLCSTLAAADLLALPVNFDVRSLAMIQYSMPTKVPEYMASGAPVLVYAPGHVPAAVYAREEGWGYVVAERSPQKLETALLALMESEDTRALLGRRGRELALRRHDAQMVRQRFREVMCSATGSQVTGKQV